jgi:hypothetical protein
MPSATAGKLSDWRDHPDFALDLDGVVGVGLGLAASGLKGSEPEPGVVRPGGFLEFVRTHNPRLLAYEHIPRLASVADRVVEGELRRVLVLLPPRYFKSETFSRLLPAYYLRRHPTRHVGLASYGAELAWELSEEARSNFTADGGTLRSETRAKKRWRTKAGGVMWAAGAGGPLLGRGFHLGIPDDPIDPEKSHSPRYQKRFERWWSEKFLSRQEPGAAIVFVMQRLGVLDPVDYLLRREVGEGTPPAPEHWHVVVCDEIRSDERLGRWDGPRGLPPTCTLEPDPRVIGEVLAPSRFSHPEVLRLQAAAGPTVAAAQRQQRPSAPEGKFWRRGWFIHVYDELPATAYDGGKDWDTAYTKDDANSASAFVESYRGPDERDADGKPVADTFPIYIHDAAWEWLEFPELVAWMKAKKGPHYVEAKASGKSAAQTLRKEVVPCDEVTVHGDKFTRSVAVQPVVSAGRVHIRRSLLRHLLEGERQGLLRVTAETLLAGGPDLDLNDAFTAAIHRHTRKGPTPGVEAW